VSANKAKCLKSGIEFHDSTVLSITIGPSNVKLLLSAYVHRSEGEPGIDPTTGWSQEAKLEFVCATIEGKVPVLPLRLADGCVTVGGRSMADLLFAPSSYEGQIAVKLTFEDSSEVVLEATALRVELTGNATFIEDVPVKD
jgi:hypothetical protein